MSLPYLHPYLGLSNGLNTLHAAGAGGIGGWVELGRVTANGSQSQLSVSSLADKRYYMILTHDSGMAGAVARFIRLNDDSGTNYSRRNSVNGAADGTGTSQTAHNGFNSNNTTPQFNVHYIANYSSKEKLMISHGNHQNTAGASTAPERTEFVGKWANTSNAINRIDYMSVATNFTSGDEIVVLGWDPADSHTNNYWEELASVDLSGGAADNLTTGTFTAKKYLWVQYYVEPSGGTTNARVTFNDSTGSDYAWRRSLNGTELTSTSKAYFSPDGFEDGHKFLNMFIINNASSEKLVISHAVNVITTGAGTAPGRNEMVTKWANTSDQITRIDLDNASAGADMGTSTIMKVWGAN